VRRALLLPIAGFVALAGCRGGAAPGARDVLQEAFRQDDLTADEAQGHQVFLARCATCHGAEGRGDGQNAYNLDPPPPDFRESLAKLPAAERRRVVLGGTAAIGRSALCPPNGRSLSPEEVDAVVAWLDAASRRPPEEPADRGPGSRWKRR
jgi:mono/diheme cytochrome c family protein